MNDMTTKTMYQFGLYTFQESVLLINFLKLLVQLHFHLVESYFVYIIMTVNLIHIFILLEWNLFVKNNP